MRTVRFLSNAWLCLAHLANHAVHVTNRFMLGVGIEIENFKKSCTFFYICTTLERLKKSDVALISTLCDDFVQENGGERCDYLSAYENAPGILQSAGALGSAERWVPARA
ncbi:hypothetical protein ACXX81_01035 [Pseudomonas sp. GNP013]